MTHVIYLLLPQFFPVVLSISSYSLLRAEYLLYQSSPWLMQRHFPIRHMPHIIIIQRAASSYLSNRQQMGWSFIISRIISYTSVLLAESYERQWNLTWNVIWYSCITSVLKYKKMDIKKHVKTSQLIPGNLSENIINVAVRLPFIFPLACEKAVTSWTSSQYEDNLSRYGNSHVKDTTVLRPSYL